MVCARRPPEGSWEWEMACPFEFLASMGFHMFPKMADSFGMSPLHSVLSEYVAGQVHSLLGNGMHLVTQAPFMFYVLAFIMALDPVGGPKTVATKRKVMHAAGLGKST